MALAVAMTMALALHLPSPLPLRSASPHMSAATIDLRRGGSLEPERADAAPAARPAKALKRISTEAQLGAVLARSQEELTVVKFFAPWCQMCRSIEKKFATTCRKMPEHTFCEVDFGKSKPLAFMYDVKVLPTIAVFVKGELVKTVPVTFKAWKRFEDELGMIAKEEIDGEYVPRNTCDDNFWKCIQEGDEVSRVDHEYNN